MPVDRGYILPDNPFTEELRCLLVFIPKDEQDMYLRAFDGAFNQLSKWTSWERDYSTRAAVAATVWKDAVDYTYTNGWDRCMDILDRIADLENQVRELIDMNINVNCGCGCGCGNQNDPLNLGDPGLPDSNVIVPEITTGSSLLMTQQQRCDMANWLADSYVNVFIEFNANWEVVSSSVNALVTAIQGKIFGGAGASVVTFAATIITTILNIMASGILGNLSQNARDAAQNAHDDLVCAVALSSSPLDAEQRFEAVLASQRAVYGNSAYVLLWAVAQLWNWDKVMTPGELTVPSSYVGSDCSSCYGGTTGDWPETPSGYEWRLPSYITLNADDPDYETNPLVISSDGVEGTTTITDPSGTWNVLFDIGVPLLAPGEEIVANTWLCTISERSGGGGNGPSYFQNGNTALNAPYRWLRVRTGESAAVQAVQAYDEVVTESNSYVFNNLTAVTILNGSVGAGQPDATLHLKGTSLLYLVKLP